MSNHELRKWIIVDPCCYPDGGHNIDSCLRFAKQIENSGGAIHEFWLAGNSKSISNKGYNVKKLPKLYVQLMEEGYQTKYKYKFYQIFMLVIKFTLFGIFIDFILRIIARFSLSRKMKHLDPKIDYIIYFPSCDYYFAHETALLSKKNDKIQLKYRFIGVMEYAKLEFKGFPNRLFKVIRGLPDEKINLQAEVKRYADLLTGLLGKKVTEKPYPTDLTSSVSSEKEILYSKAELPDDYNPEMPLKILLLGRPRIDKGSLDLKQIAQSTFERFGNRVHFDCMSFPEEHRFSEKKFLQDTRTNITYHYEKWLPKEKYLHQMASAEVLLLPYDIGVYWYRGSAVCFDAMEKTKKALILARKGNAFADEMFSKDVILEYATINDLMEHIEVILNNGRQKNTAISMQKRETYKKLVS